MSFLEEILANSLQLIKNYIEEHQASPNKINIWFKLFSVDLKTIKINSANKLLTDIRQYLDTIYIPAQPYGIRLALEFILSKIQEQIDFINIEREKRNFKPGVYDARLAMFKKFLNYILEKRIQNIEYIMCYASEELNKHIIKILLILEKNLLTTVFNYLMVSNENYKLLIKFLTDYIARLKSVQLIDTTNKKTLHDQIIFLKNLLDGVIFDLENKPEFTTNLYHITFSLINELDRVKKSVLQEYDLYQQQANINSLPTEISSTIDPETNTVILEKIVINEPLPQIVANPYEFTLFLPLLTDVANGATKTLSNATQLSSPIEKISTSNNDIIIASTVDKPIRKLDLLLFKVLHQNHITFKQQVTTNYYSNKAVTLKLQKP